MALKSPLAVCFQAWFKHASYVQFEICLKHSGHFLVHSNMSSISPWETTYIWARPWIISNQWLSLPLRSSLSSLSLSRVSESELSSEGCQYSTIYFWASASKKLWNSTGGFFQNWGGFTIQHPEARSAARSSWCWFVMSHVTRDICRPWGVFSSPTIFVFPCVLFYLRRLHWLYSESFSELSMVLLKFGRYRNCRWLLQVLRVLITSFQRFFKNQRQLEQIFIINNISVSWYDSPSMGQGSRK